MDDDGSRVVLIGLFLGLVFGVFLLLQGVLGALLVMVTSGIGALTAWLLNGVLRGRFDIGGAWKALRQKSE